MTEKHQQHHTHTKKKKGSRNKSLHISSPHCTHLSPLHLLYWKNRFNQLQNKQRTQKRLQRGTASAPPVCFTHLHAAGEWSLPHRPLPEMHISWLLNTFLVSWVTSFYFPSPVLAHLLIHAIMHSCTHTEGYTHAAWLHLFHPGYFISFHSPLIL